MTLEDFTTFTTVDLGDSTIVGTTTSTNISACLHNDADNFYTYLDKGANYYNGDFLFRFKLIISLGSNPHHGVYPQDGGRNQFWALANMLGDRQDIINSSENELCLQFYPGQTPSYPMTIALQEIYGGTSYMDTSITIGAATHYISVIRDESVGSYGTAYIYICAGNYYGESGSSTTDILTLTLHGKIDFRYLYALQNWNRTSGFWNYYCWATVNTLEYTPSISPAVPRSFGYIIN
jgi:hypothetical protein